MTKKNNIIHFPSASPLATLKQIMGEAEAMTQTNQAPSMLLEQILSSLLRLEAFLKKQLNPYKISFPTPHSLAKANKY